jgi:hypothetical protein
LALALNFSFNKNTIKASVIPPLSNLQPKKFPKFKVNFWKNYVYIKILEKYFKFFSMVFFPLKKVFEKSGPKI